MIHFPEIWKVSTILNGQFGVLVNILGLGAPGGQFPPFGGSPKKVNCGANPEDGQRWHPMADTAMISLMSLDVLMTSPATLAEMIVVFNDIRMFLELFGDYSVCCMPILHDFDRCPPQLFVQELYPTALPSSCHDHSLLITISHVESS